MTKLQKNDVNADIISKFFCRIILLATVFLLKKGICGELLSFFFCFYNTANAKKLPAATWVRQKLFLSCNFTKKRPSKIFKIENFNRQTHNKNALIFTK